MAVEIGGLRVDETLYNLVRDEIAPGTDVDPVAFWTALGEIVRRSGPREPGVAGKAGPHSGEDGPVVPGAEGPDDRRGRSTGRF